MCRKQHKIMAQKRLEKGQLRKKISEDVNARKTVMLTHLTNNLGIEKNAPAQGRAIEQSSFTGPRT